MSAMILTRDEILDAIDRIQRRQIIGLCFAFQCSQMMDYLADLGADVWEKYKWPTNEQGRQQRLLFLAFMLTWHDDITGYKP
jgi:hypothetical protein